MEPKFVRPERDGRKSIEAAYSGIAVRFSKILSRRVDRLAEIKHNVPGHCTVEDAGFWQVIQTLCCVTSTLCALCFLIVHR